MPRFEDLMSNVLDIPANEVTDDLGPATTAVWTSLRHVQLIATVQRAYGIKFTAREVRTIRTVGGLRELLRGKGVNE